MSEPTNYTPIEDIIAEFEKDPHKKQLLDNVATESRAIKSFQSPPGKFVANL